MTADIIARLSAYDSGHPEGKRMLRCSYMAGVTQWCWRFGYQWRKCSKSSLEGCGQGGDLALYDRAGCPLRGLVGLQRHKPMRSRNR